MLSHLHMVLSVIALVACLFSSRGVVEYSNEVTCQFSTIDSGYSFLGRFKINANPDCLLGITFSYRHMSELAQDAKEVKLVNQGDNWNQIRYTYQKFIYFRNITEWYRELDEANNRLEFTMISSHNNTLMMPELISSSGYYQIIEMPDYVILEYFQECKISHSALTKLYLKRVRKKAERFMHEFYSYTHDFCG